MAIGYKIRIDGGALANVVTDVGNVNTHTFTGLDYEVEYAIDLKKYNSGGESAYTAPETETCPTAPKNVALASNGATVTVTSEYDAVQTPASALIDGDRTGGAAYLTGAKNWVSSADPAVTPQRAEITFPAPVSISQIDVISSPQTLTGDDPTCSGPTLPESSDHAVKDYTLEYWNGSAWVNIQTVTGNTDLWRKKFFTPVTATKFAVEITASTGVLAKAYLAELEAWQAGLNPVVVVNEGDSRMQITTVTAQVQRLLNHNFCIQCIATSGQRVQEMVSGGQVASQAVPLYNANAVDNIIIQSGGANDFAGGRTAAQLMTDYTTWCGEARAAGFKIIACTVCPIGTIGGYPELDAFNILLRTNPGGIYDLLVDLAAHPSLIDPANTTFYTDTLHWTGAGATVVAGMLKTGVQLLAPF